MNKILCITENLNSGGAERQLVGLAIALHKAGYQVKFVSYIPDKLLYKPLLDEAGVDCEVLDGVKGGLSRLRVIRKAIKAYKPDVVISFLPAPSQWTILAKLTGVKFKLIVSERSHTDRIGVRERIKFFLYRFADAVVANSYYEKNIIAKNVKSLAKKCYAITNFTDTTLFTPPTEPRDFSQNKMLVVGRLIPSKNAIKLLEALKRVIDKSYNISLRWVGHQYDLDYKQLVENKIAELSLENNVEFLTHTQNIVQEYRDATIFCLPSLFEGYPNVLCEAMSCGLPVLCGDVCENSMILDNGKGGFLFDPYDVDSIERSILLYLDIDVKQRELFAIHNRAVSKNKFNENIFLNSYNTIIKSI